MSQNALERSRAYAKVLSHRNVWGKETVISHSGTIKSHLHIEKWITGREKVILSVLKLHYEQQVVLTLFVCNVKKQKQ